jgi:hypothetical protein
MKYVVEMSSGAIIYIPIFIKSGSAIDRGCRQHGDRISLLLFFQNKDIMLKYSHRLAHSSQSCF